MIRLTAALNCQRQIIFGLSVVLTLTGTCLAETTQEPTQGNDPPRHEQPSTIETTPQPQPGAETSQETSENGQQVATTISADATREDDSNPATTATQGQLIATQPQTREEEQGRTTVKVTTAAQTRAADATTVASIRTKATTSSDDVPRDGSTTRRSDAPSSTGVTVTEPSAATTTTASYTPRQPQIACVLCNGTDECTNSTNTTTSTTCLSSTGICYVLYDLTKQHVVMSCASKESGQVCLSEFASNVAGGFCEYCCMTELCNDDWTLASIIDDCARQSASAAVQRWPLTVGVILFAVHALLSR